MCIRLQIIPEQVSFDGEISECEDTSQHSNSISANMNEESFDRLIPFHQGCSSIDIFGEPPIPTPTIIMFEISLNF